MGLGHTPVPRTSRKTKPKRAAQIAGGSGGRSQSKPKAKPQSYPTAPTLAMGPSHPWSPRGGGRYVTPPASPKAEPG
jgi:hypothetical protein